MEQPRNSSSQHWLLLCIGVWLLASPYIGFPRSIKEIVFMLSGVVCIWLSYVLARPVCEHGVARVPHNEQHATPTA